MIAAISAFYTNQIVLGTLILFYCQMQLSEALIWKGLDNDNNNLNRFGTIYGKYFLATHVFAVGLGILLMKRYNNEKIKKYDYLPLIIGILFFLFIVNNYYNKKETNLTYPYNGCSDKKCQNSNNRLSWSYEHSWYLYSFIICTILLLLYIRPLLSFIFISLTFFVTFLYTIIKKDANTVGSVWCFIAAILSPLIVFINYLIINKK